MKNLLALIIVFSTLVSCSTSNDVVSNKLFQKRKYNKGWHYNGVKPLPNNTEDITQKAEVKNENTVNEQDKKEQDVSDQTAAIVSSSTKFTETGSFHSEKISKKEVSKSVMKTNFISNEENIKPVEQNLKKQTSKTNQHPTTKQEDDVVLYKSFEIWSFLCLLGGLASILLIIIGAITIEPLWMVFAVIVSLLAMIFGIVGLIIVGEGDYFNAPIIMLVIGGLTSFLGFIGGIFGGIIAWGESDF